MGWGNGTGGRRRWDGVGEWNRWAEKVIILFCKGYDVLLFPLLMVFKTIKLHAHNVVR